MIDSYTDSAHSGQQYDADIYIQCQDPHRQYYTNRITQNQFQELC